MEITHGIVQLLNLLCEKPEKHWREIRTLFEQVVLMIDVQEASTPASSHSSAGGSSICSEQQDKASVSSSSAVLQAPFYIAKKHTPQNNKERSRSRTPHQLM